MYIVHVTANNEAIQAQQQLLQDLYPHWSAEFPGNQKLCRGGDKLSLRAFASMPNTEIFLRARAEIKN